MSDGDRSNVVGTYDSQDRLQSLGAVSYAHNGAGQRTSKIVAGVTTAYSYDELGNLLSVNLPGGTTIEYAVDAQGRRVARYENGSQTHGFIHQDALNPVAELNADGSVRALFVYGSKANTPDMIVKGADVYRVVSDLRGSVRRVVNVSTGAVVQAMDYDAWGRVLSDSNPGFQPFGYAGGLYDPTTELLRFGARDYDPFTARWTAKDPILFSGGDSDLYAYVGGDPINYVDPSGLFIDPIDAICIGLDIKDILEDNVYGDEDNLAENLINLGLDLLGLAAPGGGLGRANKMVRDANKARKKGDRWKKTHNAVDQLNEIEAAQRKKRQQGRGEDIESIEKSKQRAKDALKPHNVDPDDWD